MSKKPDGLRRKLDGLAPFPRMMPAPAAAMSDSREVDKFRFAIRFPISLPHNIFLDIVGYDPPSLLRQVQCWIVREEMVRHEIELVPQYGHHRPVFRLWHVVKSDRVPQNNVRIFNRSIGFRPGRQSISALALRRIVTCSVAFIFAVRRDPHLIICKSGSLLGMTMPNRRSEHQQAGTDRDRGPCRRGGVIHDVDRACAFDIAIPKWRIHIPAGLVSGALVQAPPFLIG